MNIYKIQIAAFLMSCAVATAQTYDSTSLVDTNNTNTSIVNSTNTNTNTNTNNNINTTTVDSRNVNTNDSTNRNINTGHTTSENTNRNYNYNYNQSYSESKQDVNTVNRNDNYNRSDVNQKIEQPPPSAIAPSMMSGGNSDLCTTGVSGAVQTQVLGISGGATIRDMNCERLKLSKTLYDMGMKVAAVATMCQDRRVWDAMMAAGTPCPYEGKIGSAALAAWAANPDKIPPVEREQKDDTLNKVGIGAAIGALLLLIF